MSTEQDSAHPRRTDPDAPASGPGLIVEDSGRPDQARRFRFVVSTSGAAFLTAEEAADLGRWLIWQAASGTP